MAWRMRGKPRAFVHVLKCLSPEIWHDTLMAAVEAYAFLCQRKQLQLRVPSYPAKQAGRTV